MHTPAPTPARLRVIVEGSDRLPAFSPEFEVYADTLAKLGITPDRLHPVIETLIRQAALSNAAHHGWTHAFAIELAAEQAEEFRQLGLTYQLDTLNLWLQRDDTLVRQCLHLVRCGQTDLAVRLMELPVPEKPVRRPAYNPPRRQRQRR